MTALADPNARRKRRDLRTWIATVAARPGFQKWAARTPVARWIARREGEALFDLVQGFVASQVLMVLVELRLLHRLADGPLTAGELSEGTGIPPDRMARLAQAGAALGLLVRRGDGYGLAMRGAALLGVPGLEQMIRHHDILYRDLRDPVAFLRGETDTELSRFWPYVFGASGASDPETAQRYSELMAQSQGLVAQDTLQTVSFNGTRHLLDIGGGTGAFVEAALASHPNLTATLLDLPAVTSAAQQRLAGSPVLPRLSCCPASFRDDPLPNGPDGGPDAVSLIRVLYDHQDPTVKDLLTKIYACLPSGGQLTVSEPMSGGQKPDPAGDVYFAFYCMAMQTGTVRSQAQIADMLHNVGFRKIRTPRPIRPFVTSVVCAQKP